MRTVNKNESDSSNDTNPHASITILRKVLMNWTCTAKTP